MSEAEVILGKPESTIRRLIRQGTVTGEQVLRDPDNPRDGRRVWRVLVTDPPPSAEPIESEQSPAIRHEPSGLEPLLLTKLDERDATIAEMREYERAQADRIAALTAEKAVAELAATHAANDAQRHAQRAVEAEARAADLARQLERGRGRSWLDRLLGR